MCESCFWRSFFIVYCPDKYKTKEMCGEAVDDSLAAKWSKNVLLLSI